MAVDRTALVSMAFQAVAVGVLVFLAVILIGGA